MKSNMMTIVALAVALGCSPVGPEAIAYDRDGCAYCRMQISDRRFGAVLVTVKGRTVKFDSVECLIAYYEQAAPSHSIAGVWVSDFRHPGTMLDARSARFVNLGPGRTPMGRGWAAVATTSDAATIGVDTTEGVKRWSDVQ